MIIFIAINIIIPTVANNHISRNKNQPFDI